MLLEQREYLYCCFYSGQFHTHVNRQSSILDHVMVTIEIQIIVFLVNGHLDNRVSTVLVSQHPWSLVCLGMMLV